MNKKQLYESIINNVSKSIKEELYRNSCDSILEEYDLEYIFALNEDILFNDAIMKLKLPFSKALLKIKSKFGNLAGKAIADIVKKAEQKGKKYLIGTLTLISLFAGTTIAKGEVAADFPENLQKNTIIASLNMAKARGLSKEDITPEFAREEFDKFLELLEALEDDENNLYAASGVGSSENEVEANKLAKDDAIKALKEKYGNDAIRKYNIKFKNVTNTWYIRAAINGNDSEYKAYYTTIVVAYHDKK